jgi:hypothetical protein
MRRCRRDSIGRPTIEERASCASLKREIQCFPATLGLHRPDQESTKCGIFDQDTAAIRAKQWCM